MSPTITGSPVTSLMRLRASARRPPVIAVPQIVVPLRPSTPRSSPDENGTMTSGPSPAGLAPPISPVPPAPCVVHSVSPLRASIATAMSSRCTATTRPS